MATLLQDIQFSYRMLIKKPAFTTIAIITIALGIGANSAIFSVVNTVLLNPLPLPNAEQLVMIWGKLPSRELAKLNASPPEFVDFRDRNQAFSAVAVYASLGRNLTGAGEPERHTVTFVTADLFPMLEVQPLRGRAFFAEEDRPGHNQVVILSYGLWQRRFAGDERIIGQTVMLDGRSQTVIGVMPKGFQFPDADTDIWKPMAFADDDLSEDSRGSHYLNLIARMKPGVTSQQAQTDVSLIAGQMQQEHPRNYEETSGWGATVVSLRDEIVGDTRLILIVLLCTVGFVLLIACANVANLLLARAATRKREIAIRTALGASRWRIIRQLLTESLALSMCGGALGILLALWGKDLLAPLIPANLPQASEIHNEPQNLLPFVREAVQGLDNDQPIYSVSTMEHLVSRSIAPRRLNMLRSGRRIDCCVCAHKIDGKFVVQSERDRRADVCGHHSVADGGSIAGLLHSCAASYESRSDDRAQI